MRYVFPKFSNYSLGLIRFGGAGLGNLLFVYARALVYAKKYNLTLIDPIWPSFKIGTYLRREKDKRHYFNIFKNKRFSSLISYVSLLFADKIRESDFLKKNTKGKLLIVEGLGNHFDDFIDDHELIKKNILHNAQTHIFKAYEDYNSETIAVHVRLGDYALEHRTDLSWYVEKINVVRTLGYNYEVILFSDGEDKELAQLLSIDRVKRIKNPNALSDLLRMSKSEILIGANSTFSAWASFIGRNHFIKPENFYLKNIYSSRDRAYEGTLEIKDYNELKNYCK